MNSLSFFIVVLIIMGLIVYVLKRVYDCGFNRGYVYYETEIKREIAEIMKKYEEE